MARNIAKAKAGKAKSAAKPRTPAKPQGVTKSEASTPAKPKGVAKPKTPAKPRRPARSKTPAYPTPAPTTSQDSTPTILESEQPSLITTLKLPMKGLKRTACEMLANEVPGAGHETEAEIAAKKYKNGEPISLGMRMAMIKAGFEC